MIEWTLAADYYFEKETGILLAENLHFHRFDFRLLKPELYSHADFYVNRTLAMVNSIIIMDSYVKIGENVQPTSDGVYIWIVSLAVIIPFVAIAIIVIRKHFFRRN